MVRVNIEISSGGIIHERFTATDENGTHTELARKIRATLAHLNFSILDVELHPAAIEPRDVAELLGMPKNFGDHTTHSASHEANRPKKG